MPKVDELLAYFDNSYRIRPLKYSINCVLNAYRNRIKNNQIKNILVNKIVDEIIIKYKNLYKGTLQKVINATGVIIHTNLGRSPFSRDDIINNLDILSGYSNLEFNLDEAERGNRYKHLREYLRILTGKESSLIVNNNAAAVFLILNTLSFNKEVLVSRGELVEIGGSFRIPDVIARSGAIIKEVGTTNKTKISDYIQGINENTAILLKVHKSNYKIIGFTEEVAPGLIPSIATKHNLFSYFDLGSGVLDRDICDEFEEPSLSDRYIKDFDLVSFSGDKLLGGVQSGIIAGREDLIRLLMKNPLLRMLRVDKTTIAILQETLKHYIFEESHKIPIIDMIKNRTKKSYELSSRLKDLIDKSLENYLLESNIVEDKAYIGGGSCPGKPINVFALALSFKNIRPQEVKHRLLKCDSPVLTRINKERLILNVVTLDEKDYQLIVEALKLCVIL
ncbi:MAG: L-seryl-tRNA(Sec) selenium transferase [Deferribacterota bacterium]|nr:L-seryl-tRNA(Sec) selenium transferase [Deferribacterota bacterium]